MQVYNTELKHFGVKGMKWGVKKKFYKDHMNTDRVLKKGFEIQNISTNKKREITNNPIYGAYTNHDKQAYSGSYAKNIMWYGDKAYTNSLVLTKDVKIPSQKKSVDVFMELYNKDPKGMSDSIGKAYAELDYFHGISKIRNFNANRISKKLQSKGQDWMENKGYLMFNQSMMSTTENTARNKYYELLIKKGFNAISDVNDVQSGYGSDDPIIFINPKNTIKNVKSRQLTVDEVELANARYEYDEVKKNVNFISKILPDSNYNETKRNLKRIEKEQAV